jgi:hypothetical protein
VAWIPQVIGELASPIVSIGPKSVVLTNQRTQIRNAHPNPEREPQSGYDADIINIIIKNPQLGFSETPITGGNPTGTYCK